MVHKAQANEPLCLSLPRLGNLITQCLKPGCSAGDENARLWGGAHGGRGGGGGDPGWRAQRNIMEWGGGRAGNGQARDGLIHPASRDDEQWLRASTRR